MVARKQAVIDDRDCDAGGQGAARVGDLGNEEF